MTAAKIPEPVSEVGKPSPEMVALQKKLADMETALRTQSEAAERATRSAVEKDAYGALYAELNGKVRPEMQKDLADLLFHARRQVYVNDDGQTVFKVKASRGKGLPEEDLEYPLADGVKEFFKSQSAAPYLPPPMSGAGDSGRQPFGTRSNGGNALSNDPATRTAQQLAALGISL